MRLVAGLVALVLWGMFPPMPATAGEGSPVVIELFTSQGCSSCPPADELLARLARRDDVLALSLHVDYWDYIGWPDNFARPEHTERQKAYARAAGMRTIYTPQMIIAGVDHVIGAKAMDVIEYIEMRREAPERIVLEAELDGGVLRIEARPTAPLPPALVVTGVDFLERAEVHIQRGENAGRVMTYTNIVTDMRELGRWNGQGTLRIELPKQGDGAFAVLIQEEGPGEILAARRLR